MGISEMCTETQASGIGEGTKKMNLSTNNRRRLTSKCRHFPPNCLRLFEWP